MTQENWPRFIFATDRRVLNLRQSQRFLEMRLGNFDFFVRRACEGCRAREGDSIKRPEFYVLFGVYLRLRNLSAKNVEEYYLLYAIFYLLHMLTINSIGIFWVDDEIFFPDEAEWDQLPQRYVAKIQELLNPLVRYIAHAIEGDPLD